MVLYLIDGHNLIGSGRVPGVHLAQEDDEYRLVQWLRARQPKLAAQMVVVFDGGIPGGWSPALSGGGVRVFFAAQHHARADRIILDRVKQVPLKREVTVVSDDRVLREAVEAAGARVMRTAEFVQKLERRRQHRKRPRAGSPRPEPRLSEAEVEAWLRLFEGGREDG
ncbi:MAG: hypothetical protein D6775_02065 [Caldilineae bacterium]|nr:MAG: hypothetical protein D6775_02065 [Caldilineae bacterium]